MSVPRVSVVDLNCEPIPEPEAALNRALANVRQPAPFEDPLVMAALLHGARVCGVTGIMALATPTALQVWCDDRHGGLDVWLRNWMPGLRWELHTAPSFCADCDAALRKAHAEEKLVIVLCGVCYAKHATEAPRPVFTSPEYEAACAGWGLDADGEPSATREDISGDAQVTAGGDGLEVVLGYDANHGEVTQLIPWPVLDELRRRAGR